MAHEEERLVQWPVLNEVDGEVGDDVSHITLDHVPALGGNKLRIKIDSLPRQNAPLIESGGVAAKVPLAEHARVIPRRLEILRHRGLRTVEAIKGWHAVEMAVLAGKDRDRKSTRLNSNHLGISY